MKSQERNGGRGVAAASRARFSSGVTGLRRSTGRFHIGTPELVGLVSAAALFLAALFSYFFLLAPANKHLIELGAQRAELQRRLHASTEGVKTGGNTEASVAEISMSLRDFESQHLPLAGEGRTALIDELNVLIRRNGLRIASELSFTALDARAPGAARTQSGARSSIANSQTIYPGTGINMTLEGEYLNLRRFIRDIESSQQFIVINDVELESASDSNAARRSLLSLRLNMVAYFQRTVSPESAPATQGER